VKMSLLQNSIVKIGLVIIIIVCILILPVSLPPKIGDVDFRPYWSSSYLLRVGQDFSDVENMDRIERTLTGWDGPYTMSAWFAPTGNLILLPFTFVPFARAAYYWLVINIFVLFFSAISLWNKPKDIWIPLVLTFAFSGTLLSLIAGQVNTLVLLGLALFTFFSSSKRDLIAGACLALTTIKPHLVILTLPLLVLDMIWNKKWRMFAGFVGTLIVCAITLWIIHPSWHVSFWQVITSGMSSYREAPTIPGLLVHGGDRFYGRWFWAAGLILSIIVWWIFRNRIDQRILIDTSILAGMIISPIGWSYDQIILLVPLIHVVEWMAAGVFDRNVSVAVMLAFTTMYLASLYQRTVAMGEVWYFWISLAATVIYVFVWSKRVRIQEFIFHDINRDS